MKILPRYRDYTIDTRLAEFRKVAYGERIDFIPFDSPAGQHILQQIASERCITTMPSDYIAAFHEAYLAQQGIADQSEHCGVEHENLVRLYDDAQYYYILYDNSSDRAGVYINIVEKTVLPESERQMVTIEFAW
jgi:hypothetical protein